MDLEIKVQQRTGEGATPSPVRTFSLLNLSCDSGADTKPHPSKLSHYVEGFRRGRPTAGGAEAGLKTGFDREEERRTGSLIS